MTSGAPGTNLIAQRQALEDIIRQRARTDWIATAEALVAIHEHKLYREGTAYSTFADYLKSLDMSRQLGYFYVYAGKSWRNVQLTVQTPIPMMHAATLYGLPIEQQVEFARRIGSEHITLAQLMQLVEIRKRESAAGHDAQSADVSGLFNVVGGPNWAIELADAAETPFNDLDLIAHSPPYCVLDPDKARELDYVEYFDYDEYRDRLMPVWADSMYRALAPWGRLALVVAIDITRPRREPLAADWVHALQAAGFHYRTWIHWWEGNISKSVARGTPDPSAPNVICPVEAVLVFHKGPVWNLAEVRLEHPDRWDRHDLTKMDWFRSTHGAWTIAGQRSAEVGGFPAAYPRELIRRLITLYSFPRARVGDLFLGSGTTGEVAVELGRNFFGSEISPRWVNFARDRVLRASRAAAA